LPSLGPSIVLTGSSHGTEEVFEPTCCHRQSPQYLSNLSEDIKRKVTPHHSGGLSTSTGLYAQLWHAASNALLPSSISRIWTDKGIDYLLVPSRGARGVALRDIQPGVHTSKI